MNEELNARLAAISAQDVRALVKAEEDYGTSWKDRGGVGAFFVWVRKYDRMVQQLKKFHYDVFAAVKADQRPEGLIDDIRDARRYLLLWEDELQQLGYVKGKVAKEPDHLAGSPVHNLLAAVKDAPTVEAGPGYLRDEVRAFAVMLEEHLRVQGGINAGNPPAERASYYASHVNVEAGKLFALENERAKYAIKGETNPTEEAIPATVMALATQLLNYAARLGFLPRRTVVERALDYHLAKGVGNDDAIDPEARS